MNDKEIRDYLKVYEREVEKKYDDVDLEKIQLPSDFKERTMDKIISGRNDEKTSEYRKHKILRLLTKAAAVVVFISSVLFAATKMDANIFGFDAWKTTKTDKDSAGNFGITYDKNKKTKENGGRKDMQTMTSAYANKMLKSLEEDKAFWVNKEATSSTYVAAINEEPVVPEYDYTEVAATITSLDEKIAIIKHALNVTNSNEKVQVGDAEMSIDTILIKMAQLNKRKSVLDQMRKQLPKAREEQRSYMSRNTVPEYRYINYDLELIKKEYEAVSKTIMEMQMALDKYNQTVQFEVDI